MLDYLIEDNSLKNVLLREGITDQDILFIKELIAGYIDPSSGKLPIITTMVSNYIERKINKS